MNVTLAVVNATMNATIAPKPRPPGPPYTMEQLHTAAKVGLTVAVLSIFGAGMIVLTYFLIKRVRNFRNRLLLYLSIADLGSSSCYMAGALRVLSPGGLNADPAACAAQGFLLQVFHNIANCWVIFITLTLYLNCFHTHVDVPRYEKHMIAFSIGFPIIDAFIGLGAFQYGPAGIWCWFAGPNAFIAQQALWFSIGYSTLLFILLVYGRISWRLIAGARQFGGAVDLKTKRRLKKFAFYPLAYVLIWASGIIRRIVEVDTPNSYPFLILQITFVPAQGILNFIGYFIHRRMYEYWYVILGRRSPVKKVSIGSSTSTTSSGSDSSNANSATMSASSANYSKTYSTVLNP